MDDSKVPDADIRRQAAALYMAWYKADQAYDAHVEAHDTMRLSDDVEARIAAIEDACHAQVHVLRAASESEISAIREAAVPGSAAIEAQLKAVADAASDAYDEFDSSAIELDADGHPVLCALSGVPIFEDDEVLRDDAGQVVLRSVVGLPPRPVEEEDEVENELEAV